MGWLSPFRSSRSEVFLGKGVLQFYWNHTWTWVFSCKLAAYFQNTFFYEHLWMAASVLISSLFWKYYVANGTYFFCFPFITEGVKWLMECYLMFMTFNSIVTILYTSSLKESLSKKCPYLELFWSVFSRI